MPEWISFSECLWQKIDCCQLQEKLSEEIYEQVSKRDPLNTTRLNNILMLQKLALKEITRLMSLLVKYNHLAKSQRTAAEGNTNYYCN